MTAQEKEKLYTADDIWELSQASDDKRYELSNGVLIEVSPSGDESTVTGIWIGYLVIGFVVLHDLGEVTGADGGYQLADGIVRAPNVGFISKARLTPMTGKYYPFAPDLAVEVVSPNDAASAINDKLIEYFTYGTRLVWVVYPKSRTIHVFKSATDVRILTVNDMLDGGDVLPGFSIPVGDVFKRLRDS